MGVASERAKRVKQVYLVDDRWAGGRSFGGCMAVELARFETGKLIVDSRSWSDL